MCLSVAQNFAQRFVASRRILRVYVVVAQNFARIGVHLDQHLDVIGGGIWYKCGASWAVYCAEFCACISCSRRILRGLILIFGAQLIARVVLPCCSCIIGVRSRDCSRPPEQWRGQCLQLSAAWPLGCACCIPPPTICTTKPRGLCTRLLCGSGDGILVKLCT